MRSTQHFFAIRGEKEAVNSVLTELQFKGAQTFLCGTKVTNDVVKNVFAQNKSVICFANDLAPNLIYKVTMLSITESRLQTSSTISVALKDYPNQFKKITELMNCDLGDLKSNVSCSTSTAQEASCAYCRYLDGFQDNNSPMLYKSENFFVVHTIGQFCKGYLLIIPFKHVMSMAELSEEELNELHEVIYDLKQILKLTYSSEILVWENGSGSSGKSKAKDSVVHAHVHVAPVVSLFSNKIVKTKRLQFNTVTLSTLHHYKENPYLLIQDSSTPLLWHICPSNNVYIPRQYVRQLLAEDYRIFDSPNDKDK